VSPFSYLSYQTTSSVQGTEGQQVSGTTEADVICSVIGQMFGSGGSPLIKITTTRWGPPVTRSGDVCYWDSLACSVGTPTCIHGYGIIFTIGCPSYTRIDWLVVEGACIVSVAEAASGPGPCD
jgi:hypothetical protein